MECHPSTTIKGALDDEETMPLDGEASSPDPEGNGPGAAEVSDHDEHPVPRSLVLLFALPPFFL